MKIGLISLRSGQCGVTSIGLLVALYMGKKYDKEIAYLTIGSKGDVCNWTDTINNDDISKSTSQIYQMIIRENISQKEIKAYASNISDKVDVYEISSEKQTIEEAIEIQSYLINKIPYSLKIIDIGNPYTKNAIGLSAIDEVDMLIMVLNSNKFIIDEGLAFLEQTQYKDKKKIVVINNHNEEIITRTLLQGKKVIKNKVPRILKESIIFPINSRIPSYQNASAYELLADNLIEVTFPEMMCLENPINELSTIILANSGDKNFLGGI